MGWKAFFLFLKALDHTHASEGRARYVTPRERLLQAERSILAHAASSKAELHLVLLRLLT